jgi:hypothetical protein
MTTLKNIASLLDPDTYGFSRTPVVIGVLALTFMAIVGTKLLSVLHAAGLPSVP